MRWCAGKKFSNHCICWWEATLSLEQSEGVFLIGVAKWHVCIWLKKAKPMWKLLVQGSGPFLHPCYPQLCCDRLTWAITRASQSPGPALKQWPHIASVFDAHETLSVQFLQFWMKRCLSRLSATLLSLLSTGAAFFECLSAACFFGACLGWVGGRRAETYHSPS